MRWLSESKQKRLSRYLLGQLANQNQASLEDEYVADDEAFEDLEAAETELVDAYVRGRLCEQDRFRFERLLSHSPRCRERVAFARQFVARCDSVAMPAHSSLARVRGASLAWRTWRPALVPALVAAGLILVTAVGWWAVRPVSPPVATKANGAPRPAPQTAAAVPPPGAAVVARLPTATGAGGIVAVVLVPGLTRGLEQGTTPTIPESAREIRIRLDHEGETHRAYRVVIRTPEGREIWSRSDLPPTKPGARSVSIAFPAVTLPAGDFVLTLSARGPGGSMDDVADYAFRVVKQ